MKKERLIYLALAMLVVILGLMTRRYSNYLPQIINTYLGDALWATMIFLFVAFLFVNRKSGYLAILSLIFCYTIEISQLYHAPWIDHIRSYRLGGLILGYGFLWSDLIAYAMGIGVGVLIINIVNRKIAQQD